MKTDDRCILIVDDEEELRVMLKAFLERNGFTNILIAKDKSQALYFIDKKNVELALLDIMLPDGNGFEILEYIRNKSDMPVIFLTALDGFEDKKEGFLSGGDDYLVKPFEPEDLLLRIIAILRRCYGVHNPEVCQLKYAKIDFSSGRILRDNREIDLTAKEYKILKLLNDNMNNIVTIDMILENIWGPECYGYENTLMTHIYRIRDKLEPNPSKPKMLITAKGLGYKLVAE